MLPNLGNRLSLIAYRRIDKTVNQQGFSLVELTISFFFLLTIVFILLQSTDISRAISRGRYQSTAYHIASRKIESLRNTTFPSLPPGGSFTDPKLSSLPSGGANLTILDYLGKPSIKQVRVVVSWKEEEVTKTVSLDTLISQGGLHKK